MGGFGGVMLVERFKGNSIESKLLLLLNSIDRGCHMYNSTPLRNQTQFGYIKSVIVIK